MNTLGSRPGRLPHGLCTERPASRQGSPTARGFGLDFRPQGRERAGAGVVSAPCTGPAPGPAYLAPPCDSKSPHPVTRRPGSEHRSASPPHPTVPTSPSEVHGATDLNS